MKKIISVQEKYLIYVAFLGLLMLIFGAFLKITHISFNFLTGNSVLAFALMISLFVWILVFIDIFRTKPKNGLLWIIGMLLFINISPIIYLIHNRK